MLGWHCLIGIEILWWWANPLYFLGLLAYWRGYRIIAAIFAGCAVLPAVHLEMVLWLDGERILPGCILWVTSLQVAALNAIWNLWFDRKNRPECLSSENLD